MVQLLKERYQSFLQSKSGNILVDYDEILLYYPDYYKTKVEVEKSEFISQKDAEKSFQSGYRSSAFYQKLRELNVNENKIYETMKENKEVKYMTLRQIFQEVKSSIISLCDLIDYIGHYSTKWPMPDEEETNPEMEALFEKYDIMIRYYLYDELDKMQITSDDVVRIIEKLKDNLSIYNSIKETIERDEWLFTRKTPPNEMIEFMESTIYHIRSFPLSVYQKQDKLRREEEKKYLRRQHGKDII